MGSCRDRLRPDSIHFTRQVARRVRGGRRDGCTHLRGNSTNLFGFSFRSGSSASVDVTPGATWTSGAVLTISVTGFFKSSMVGVDIDWRGAGMFSLFSGVNSSFLTGESLKLRFSRFEAACARMLALCHC